MAFNVIYADKNKIKSSIKQGIIPKESLIFDAIRYLLVALFAGAGAPYLFTKIFKDGKELEQL